MLALVLAYWHEVCLVEEDVGSHEHGVVEQALVCVCECVRVSVCECV